MNLAKLADIVEKVRSKNAGPFWLTIDIFCGDAARFKAVSDALDNRKIAKLLGAEEQLLKRFDMADLSVVKLSVPRPNIQGAVEDRDMHGASWAALLGEMELPEAAPNLGAAKA